MTLGMVEACHLAVSAGAIGSLPNLLVVNSVSSALLTWRCLEKSSHSCSSPKQAQAVEIQRTKNVKIGTAYDSLHSKTAKTPESQSVQFIFLKTKIQKIPRTADGIRYNKQPLWIALLCKIIAGVNTLQFTLALVVGVLYVRLLEPLVIRFAERLVLG
jgi:hypothetical protein